jgi:uncharacterized OB-fold protein
LQDSVREKVAGLLPVITEFEKPFWDALAKGELYVQRCPACGNTQFPPSPVCTKCLSGDVSWIPCGGGARVWAKVEFHKAYLEPYQDTPYPVLIAKMDEGHIITGRVSAENAARLSHGDKLRVSFCQTADGTTLVEFVPHEEFTER